MSVIDIGLDAEDDLDGEFDYLDSGYSVLPIYHIVMPGMHGTMKMLFTYQLTHYDKEQTNYMQQGYRAALEAITKLGVDATLNQLYDELDRTILNK